MQQPIIGNTILSQTVDIKIMLKHFKPEITKSIFMWHSQNLTLNVSITKVFTKSVLIHSLNFGLHTLK